MCDYNNLFKHLRFLDSLSKRNTVALPLVLCVF